MPAGEFVPVTIPLYFEGHVYRAGSRIRVTISAPNGTQPVWSFDQTQPEGTTADGVDRVRARHARQPHPPDRAGRHRADGTAGLPEPAQRALPPVRGVRERRFLTATRVAGRQLRAAPWGPAPASGGLRRSDRRPASGTGSGGEGRTGRARQSLTTSLPVFPPSNSMLIAIGSCSKPSTTVSCAFSFPSAIHAASCGTISPARLK